MKIRKNDEVIVVSGKEKGKTGKVTQVFTKTNRLTIAGVNVVKKHVKPTQQNPDGGIKDREASVHVSNVAYYVKGKDGGASKLGFKYGDKGEKQRIVKKSGKVV